MAGVAKWLRQWFVAPSLVGSSPITRPFQKSKVRSQKSEVFLKQNTSKYIRIAVRNCQIALGGF